MAITKAIRTFFENQNFAEVDTPVALPTVAPELHLDAVPVSIATDRNTNETRFLQTSPELPMKKLLASGWERIYQIAPVFRDGELGPQHQPEFRLLEWYRARAPWQQLMTDCEGLLRATAAACMTHLPEAECQHLHALEAPFRRLSVQDAFERYAGFSLLDALETPALRAELDKLGLRHAPDDQWDDLFHRVFLHTIEPALHASDRPVFLTDFPAPLAALAQLNPHDPRCAERFELYAGGRELANGYGELNCPVEQRRRFEQEQEKRRALGRRTYPLDEAFLAALKSMPPAAGIALGVDRLVMFLLDVEHISQTVFLPWSST